MLRRSLAPAVLALALVAAPSAHAQQRTISVVGDATLTAANDTARVGFGTAAVRRSRVAALGASSTRLRRVLETLRAAGIRPADLRTSPVSVQRLRSRRGRPLRRYRASGGVTALVRDARRAGSVVQAGLGAGATSVRGPRFFVLDARAFARRALVLAFGDARAKAQALAREAGLTLGPPVSIRESAFQEEAATQDDAATPDGQAAPAPTRPGTSTVEASVNVVFEAR